MYSSELCSLVRSSFAHLPYPFEEKESFIFPVVLEVQFLVQFFDLPAHRAAARVFFFFCCCCEFEVVDPVVVAMHALPHFPFSSAMFCTC